jgi:hypothetical protein
LHDYQRNKARFSIKNKNQSGYDKQKDFDKGDVRHDIFFEDKISSKTTESLKC